MSTPLIPTTATSTTTNTSSITPEIKAPPPAHPEPEAGPAEPHDHHQEAHPPSMFANAVHGVDVAATLAEAGLHGLKHLAEHAQHIVDPLREWDVALKGLSTSGLEKAGKVATGFAVVATAIETYEHSPAKTEAAKAIHAGLAGGMVGAMSGTPLGLVEAGATALGAVSPEGSLGESISQAISPKRLFQGATGAVVTLGEGAILDQSAGLSAFRRLAQSGDYGALMFAADTVGDPQAQAGLGEALQAHQAFLATGDLSAMEAFEAKAAKGTYGPGLAKLASAARRAANEN